MEKGKEPHPWGDPPPCPTAAHCRVEGCPWHCAAHDVPWEHALLGTSLQIPTGPLQSHPRETPAVPVWAGADPWPSLSAAWFSLMAGWMIASSGKYLLHIKHHLLEGHILEGQRKKYCYRARKIMKLSNYLHNK